MGQHSGKCALCRNACQLTFEHIPPRAAFNSTPARPVSGEKLFHDDNRMPWDTEGLFYSNQQQGMGKYSLCKNCNNNTGAWYGDSYITFSRIVHSVLKDVIDEKHSGFGIKEVYPLRIIKQVLSMFCSINNVEDERINTLREFVLNKEATGLDRSKYKVCLYLTRSKLMKYAPISVVLRSSERGVESMALSEITAYPLGLILYFNPTDTWVYDGIDITSFSDCKYDAIATVEMPLCILEMNDVFPTFFRTKEDIVHYVESNKNAGDDFESN